MNLDLTFSEEDVKESLVEVGIKLVPQSEAGKVKMISEDGDAVYLDEDFSMFDSKKNIKKRLK